MEVYERLRVLASLERVQELLGDPGAEVDVLRAAVPLPVPPLPILAARTRAALQLPPRAVLGDGKHDASGCDGVHEGPLPRGRFSFMPVDTQSVRKTFSRLIRCVRNKSEAWLAILLKAVI